MKLNVQLVLLAMVTGSALAAPIPSPGGTFIKMRPLRGSKSESTSLAKPDASPSGSGSGNNGGGGSSSGSPNTSSAAAKTDKDGKEKEPFSKVKWYDNHGTKVNGGVAAVAGTVAIAAGVTNAEADKTGRETDAKNDQVKQLEDAKANGSSGGGGTAAARRGFVRIPSVKQPQRHDDGGLPFSRPSTPEPKGKEKEQDPEPSKPASQPSGSGNGNNVSGNIGTPHTSANKPDSSNGGNGGGGGGGSGGTQSKVDEDKKKEDRKKSVNSAQNAAAGTIGGLVGITGGAIVLDNAINKKADNEAKAAKADADLAKAQQGQRRSPSPEPLGWASAGMSLFSAGTGGGDLVGVHKSKDSATQQVMSQGSRHTGAKSRRANSPDADLLQKRLGFSFDKSETTQVTQAFQQGDSHTGATSGSGASLFGNGNGAGGSARSGLAGRHGGGSGMVSKSKNERRQLAQLIFA